MAFIPKLCPSFCDLKDPELRDFLDEICDEKKVRSFAERVKASSKTANLFQPVQGRHYLELGILALLRRKEAKSLLHILSKQLIVDSMFEAAEFISVLKDVYRQAPRDRKHYLKGSFNSGFDSVMGMIPLAHEMHVAYSLWKAGFEVEFVEYGGIDRYDFSARKGDVTAQIDCKVCGGDNGQVFKMGAAAAIFDRISKLVIKRKAIFDGKILCLSIVDRGRVPRDLPEAAIHAVGDLKDGRTVAEVRGVRAEFIPFESDLANQLRDIDPQDDGEHRIVSLIADSVRTLKPTGGSFLEYAYVVPGYGLDRIKFACVFCSPESIDWRSNAIKVVKESLGGQLKNCPCPVIFLRYSDFSDPEVNTGWYAESKLSVAADVPVLAANPLDHLFYRIVADSVVGNRLCAMAFEHRPRFHETYTLGPMGKKQTIGRYPIRTVYNRSHPDSSALSACIERLVDGQTSYWPPSSPLRW